MRFRLSRNLFGNAKGIARRRPTASRRARLLRAEEVDAASRDAGARAARPERRREHDLHPSLLSRVRGENTRLNEPSIQAAAQPAVKNGPFISPAVRRCVILSARFAHMNGATATEQFLEQERGAIIETAEVSLARAHSQHYRAAGEIQVHRRLETLFDHLVDALAGRDLTPMITYAQKVAEERFDAGYDLSEVQIAFNALEEATWSRLIGGLQPGQLAEALGLVSTILGSGKDALARRYVSLAARTHAPSLDLRALFTGTEGA